MPPTKPQSFGIDHCSPLNIYNHKAQFNKKKKISHIPVLVLYVVKVSENQNLRGVVDVVSEITGSVFAYVSLWDLFGF